MLDKKLHDIVNRDDLIILMQAFYRKAIVDKEIGFFFTEVVKLDLKNHIPKIASFWESVIFYTAGYKGNPMIVHLDLNNKSHITDLHFARWLELFKQQVDEHFIGEKATEIKQKAEQITSLMKVKIKQN
jgi:hemoglobin